MAADDDLIRVLRALADLTCDIDGQKNQLPREHREPFTQLVTALHDQVYGIADANGMVIYADQREKAQG